MGRAPALQQSKGACFCFWSCHMSLLAAAGVSLFFVPCDSKIEHRNMVR